MKQIILIIFTFISFNILANKPVKTVSVNTKPKIQLGGGKVIGTARLIGVNKRVTIISCDKSKQTCLYILKKIDMEPNIDQCKVIQPWTVPPLAESQYDYNFPYAFSFNLPVLTFCPAYSINAGCPDNQGNVEISIETDAEIINVP